MKKCPHKIPDGYVGRKLPDGAWHFYKLPPKEDRFETWSRYFVILVIILLSVGILWIFLWIN